MLINGSNINLEKKYDYVVIGSGAVGLYISRELIKNNKKVLLVESGDASHTSLAAELNEGECVSRRHLGMLDGRARVVGGTTTLWGGQLTEFDAADLIKSIENGPNWCLSYEELKKFYKKVLKSFDFNPAEPENFISRYKDGGVEIFLTRWLKEPNFASVFADEINKNINLDLVKNVRAKKILVNSEENILGIDCVDDLNNIFCAKADKYILACGTLEISRLLLVSRNASDECSWLQNNNIGKYFQDHLDVCIGYVLKKDEPKVKKLFSNLVLNGYKYQPKIKICNKNLSIASSFKFNTNFEDDFFAVKHVFRSIKAGAFSKLDFGVLGRVIGSAKIWWPLVWSYIKDKKIYALSDAGISVVLHCEQVPIYESSIKLSSSKVDRHGVPLIELDWKVCEDIQLNEIQRYVDELANFLKNYSDISLVVDKKVGDGEIIDDARDSYHQCGGACMSSRGDSGVVNKDLLVYGSRNLYICGAAVFPTSSFANPTFTALALAHRLAEHLIG